MKILYLLLILFIFNSCVPEARDTRCSSIRDCDIKEQCINGVCKSSDSPDDECTNSEQCDPGYSCNMDNHKCEIPFLCTNEQDCYDHDTNWNPQTNPVICKAGGCIEWACKTSIECKAGSVCTGGRCVTVPDCSQIVKVKVTSSSVVLREGVEKKLTVSVFNKNDVPVVVPETEFEWNSSDVDKVSINKDSGLAKGEAVSGISNITVKHKTCSLVSENFKIENFANLDTNKIRVIVRDMDTGKPVSGAKIKINTDSFTTDLKGWIETDNSLESNDITVIHNNYDYITILKLKKKDIIIHLTKHKSTDKAGGFQGKFDFSRLSTSGSVNIGIAGSSLPDSILDLSFSFLLGEVMLTHVKIGTTIDDDYPIPTSLVIELGTNKIRDKYEVIATEGNRAFWGLGGKQALSKLLPILQESMKEDSSMIDLLKGIVPFFKDFNHALELNQKVSLCSKYVDMQDKNGNGKTDDLIPSFDNLECFPEKNLPLYRALSLNTKIKMPILPTIDGVMSDMGLIMVGYDIPANGFVPVGIMMGTDKNEETDIADGKIDDQELYYAPQYNGAEGSDGLVVVFSLSSKDYTTEEGEEDKDIKVKLSGIVKSYDNGNIPNEIDLTSTPFLATGTPTLTNKQFNVEPIDGVDFHRIKIYEKRANENEDKRIWIIYSKEDSFTIPTLDEFDTFNSVLLQNVDLINNETMESLFEFNSITLEELSKLISRFSVYELDI